LEQEEMETKAIILIGISIWTMVWALGIFAYYKKFVEKAISSKHWQNISGIILESKVRLSSSRDGMDYWKPSVHYEYEVGGKMYDSYKKSFFEMPDSNKSSVESIVSCFPAEATIDVYVNPENPKQACLEPGIPSNYLAIFVMASLTVPIGIVAIIIVSIYMN
jgi:hypothetical protein